MQQNSLPLLDDAVLTEMCETYAQYPQFDAIAKHHVDQTGGQVEKVLSRVDELAAMVEVIRIDSSRTFESLLPLLVEQSEQINRVFSLVEQMEEFMREVAHCARTMDDHIAASERAYQSLQRQKSLNSYGLGAISSKFIPVKTATRMPKYKDFPRPKVEEFFTGFRAKAFDDGAAK